jgi:hypothetical protein
LHIKLKFVGDLQTLVVELQTFALNLNQNFALFKGTKLTSFMQLHFEREASEKFEQQEIPIN